LRGLDYTISATKFEVFIGRGTAHYY
jgi:hypothetical protein